MAFNWNKFPWTNLHELNLDWIIQTVKQLETKVAELGDKVAELATTVQLYTTKVTILIQEAITNTLTGSGDLTINKSGDVRISGNSVQLSRTIISDDAEQLTLHNPSDSTSLTATYRNGILSLLRNHSSGGLQVFPIAVPPDDEDNGLYAANCGYVKGKIMGVNDSLTAETSARTAGDAALQSTIDSVIMPLLNGLGERAPRIIYASIANASQDTHTLTAEQIAPIKTALLEHTPIMLCVDSTADGAQFSYQLDKCDPVPDSGNIDGALTLTFKTVSGGRTATIALNSGVITFT